MSSDLAGLHGIIATALRWNATAGILGFSTYDPAEGERSVEEIELNTPASKIALDLPTREVGYGMARKGVFKIELTPVGSPRPPWPGEGFKPAIGIWAWNPLLGELRIETCGALFRDAIDGVCSQAKVCKEARNGLVPVVQFADRLSKSYDAGTYWAPMIILVGWLPRVQIACFAAREPTVRGDDSFANSPKMIAASPPTPSILDTQLRAHLAQPPLRFVRPTDPPAEKPKVALKRGDDIKRASLDKDLDDSIPW
jgi:hypothetical protein